MRVRAIWREAWRNVWTGTARPVTLALVMLLVSLGLAVADLATVLRIDAMAQDFQRVGSSVLILEAPGAVDGRRCEALAAQPGVRAAGALRSATAQSFTATPQQRVPVYDTSPRFAEVLRVHPATATGIVLAADAADSVRARVGDPVSFGSGTVDVAGIYAYPDDGRIRRFGFAVLTPIPAGETFDQCWIDQWPQSAGMVSMLRTTTVARASDGGNPPTISQLNTTRGETFDAHGAYAARITAWGPMIVFVSAVVVAGGAVWLRRLQHTAALHLGVPRHDLLAIALIEALLWLTPTIVASVLLSMIAVEWANAEDARAAAGAALVSPGSGVLGALLGTAIGIVALRERSLFRYFKERT